MRIAAIITSLMTFCILIGGCGVQGYSANRLGPEEALIASPGSDEPPAASLFKADQAVLSNEDIEKILSAKVYPPANGRVAMIRIGGRYGTRWGEWSEQVAQLDQQTTADLLGKVRSSKRVSDAMLLPTLLQPAKTTIPYLREAAARVQGDTLLIYRTFSQTYQVQRVFGSDDVRAYCTAEAVLLDTRTGIVTYTSVASEPFSAHKTSKEVSFEETVALAEQQAAARALAKVGDEVLKFLNEAPVPRSAAKAEP